MIDYYNLFIFGIEVKYEFLSYEQPVPINLACVEFHRFNCSPWSIVCRDNSIYANSTFLYVCALQTGALAILTVIPCILVR